MAIQLPRKSILIASLGAEPQVVTTTIDLLRSQGFHIQRVQVIHTSSPEPQLRQAVETLDQVGENELYKESIALRLTPISDPQGSLLMDVATPQETQAAFRFLYQAIRSAKLGGWQTHLLIAGGRKTLTVFAMAAAQMLFDEDDHFWHLYSAGEFLTSRRLHPEPGDVARLIPIPVIRWSQVSPILTDLNQVDNPQEAIERIQSLQLREKLAQATGFVLGTLTPAEQNVVCLLVREGLSDQEIAERLGLSPRTVEQHLRSAYRKAEAHWELQDVSRSGLITLLNLYYQLRENPDAEMNRKR